MNYLQKHLPTHYRHLAQLKVHFAEENETKVAKKRPAKKNKASPPAKKPKLTKSRTMAETAKVPIDLVSLLINLSLFPS